MLLLTKPYVPAPREVVVHQSQGEEDQNPTDPVAEMSSDSKPQALSCSILASLRPGIHVSLMLSQSDNAVRLAALCRLVEEDQEAINYLLDTLQSEYDDHNQLMAETDRTAPSVGSPVVAWSDVDDTCYRGVVLANPAGTAQSTVLQMDFGNILEVSQANIFHMWPAAGDTKSFGLQLVSIVPLTASLESVLGMPVKAVVVPGKAETGVAVRIPALGDHVFDIFPWFAIRYIF